MQCQVVKTHVVHCHSDVCSAPGGHSAGCRTSWVCLQHHATVVTPNVVKICGSKFPPTVNKHCQYQHNAISKTVQQCAVPTIPAVVISKVWFPQSSIMAACVHSKSSLFFDVSSGLPKYKNRNSTKLNFYSVGQLPAEPRTRLPKLSNYQHTAVHLISQCLTAMC